MVSAWATENKLVLGQRKVDEKSNEITAIPKLLKLLVITGCIVTIDVIDTQTKIAKTIILHWVLDIAFNEDRSRVRKNNAPQKFRRSETYGAQFAKT